jgi:hypothetical protein
MKPVDAWKIRKMLPIYSASLCPKVNIMQNYYSIAKSLNLRKFPLNVLY